MFSKCNVIVIKSKHLRYSSPDWTSSAGHYCVILISLRKRCSVLCEKKKTTTKVTCLYKTHSSSAAPHQFPSLSCTWTVFLLFLSLLMCRRSIHGLHCILFAIKFWCFDHRIDNKHILDSVSFFEIQIYLNALTVFKYLPLTFHTVHVHKCEI